MAVSATVIASIASFRRSPLLLASAVFQPQAHMCCKNSMEFIVEDGLQVLM
ncbi:hypothetical protein SAY86_005261 [Trapa natans]|uniref:Uncharacterized protein n=1 Tax=Trapa natans TaxID=22666 RepID=A0AAN7L5A6_TRANT|nr:hypothetical protein SAY86_005261 [Trapa natans]